MIDFETEIEMAEAIIDIPFAFGVGDKTYHIYPETLGKLMRLKPYLAELGAKLGGDMAREAFAAYMRSPISAARVVAIYTLNNPDQIRDRKFVDDRAEELLKEVEGEDMVKLLAICLQRGQQTERLMEATGIAADHERRRKVMAAKKAKNTYFFGGKTTYGLLIDFACERYGWTLDYVLWGISYTNLQMLMADQCASLFLTDEEAKTCTEIPDSDDVIAADDPRNADLIREMFKN